MLYALIILLLLLLSISDNYTIHPHHRTHTQTHLKISSVMAMDEIPVCSSCTDECPPMLTTHQDSAKNLKCVIITSCFEV